MTQTYAATGFLRIIALGRGLGYAGARSLKLSYPRMSEKLKAVMEMRIISKTDILWQGLAFSEMNGSLRS